MKQMTFADAEYAGKRKQTRKELFLIEMDRVVPWKGLIALIEPHYPKGEGGRPAYPLMAMLRASAAELVRLQRSSDGGSAVRNHDPAPVCRAEPERIPDETTICWR
ncbi:Putative transposase (identified by ISEscan HMM) [Klebsiella pneumoniae]|nr:Putative transposase (identified by ISEscan HMM) [Klebsiella pneumoniae]